MKNIILFLKGVAVGIGKVIPGVSGSMIAALLGIYEDSVLAINHMKEDFWKNFFFLLPIGCGVFLSMLFFSNILLYFLSHYYVFTIFFFIGLIIGTVPSFRKQVSIKHASDYFFFLFGFLLPFLFTVFQSGQEVIPSFSLFGVLFVILLGFIDAFSMVIPGISGTAIFLMLGSYAFVLNLFANPFSQIVFTICFGVGLLFGIVITSRLVEFCLKHYKNHFFLVIYGLLFNSILYLLSLVFCQVSWITIAPLFFLICLGIFLSSCFS